jgi:cell division GTPase FtsZ
VSIRGARNVLVNISAGANLGMRETNMATGIVQQEAGDGGAGANTMTPEEQEAEDRAGDF